MELIFARSQMALSLGFHIVFAAIGIAMPFLMATAYAFYLRTHDESWKLLTKSWSMGVAIFFAVGAVSGTALSFELGLLWPEFMKHAGPIIGMPFSWEGAAFFLEAIALGIFLYGWNHVKPWMHWGSGLLVGICGVASAFFVICANGWMNSPAGFDWNGGHPTNIDPWAAMFNEAAWIQGLHMVVAAFSAVGMGVAGLHAWLWLKTGLALHKKAVMVAFAFGASASIVQPLVGDFAAKSVARRQPVKLAAMEAHFETQTHAPLRIGGIPDEDTGAVHYGVDVPGLLSFLAFGNTAAEVKGLQDFPREEWPPVLITHLAFQAMVALGTFLALVGVVGVFLAWKSRMTFFARWFQWLLVFCAPMGFVAIEAGWVVTEVGRQPWIIYGLLKTRDALTPRPGVAFTFGLYAAVYGVLAVLVSWLIYRQTALLNRSLSSKPGEPRA